jgi:branched-subunit amino acid transport protein
MNKLFYLVLAMGAVTFIPRMIPMVALKELKLPPRLRTFLQFIPFAVLGSLIFPGVISSTGDTRSAVAGTVTSLALAYFKLNIMIVVLGGILGVYLWQTIM